MTSAWPSFEEITQAYRDCRVGKRASVHQIRFESKLGQNLLELHRDLVAGTYRPSPVICFVVTRPKPREIFAAHFRDRIVHHLVVSRLTPKWEKKFIHSSFACRTGKGTHGALKYLQRSVRSLSQGGRIPVYALQLDLASFFVTIHRPILCGILTAQERDPKFRALLETLYLHDGRSSAVKRGTPELFNLIPENKSWFNQAQDHGLPIGNLISQFGANVYLTELDHLIQRQLKPRAYLRYMDDLTLLDTDPERLRPLAAIVDDWLKRHRKQCLNPTKTVLTRLDQSIAYLGYECRQVDSPKQPLQLFAPPGKKWEWVRALREMPGIDLDTRHKSSELGAWITPDPIKTALARVNSRVGYLRHANTYRLRKSAMDRMMREIRRADGIPNDLPPELGEPHLPIQVRRNYTAIRRR